MQRPCVAEWQDEWKCSVTICFANPTDSLQSRVRRFDSDPRLQNQTYLSEFQASPIDCERRDNHLRFLLRPGAVTQREGELVQKAVVAVFPPIWWICRCSPAVLQIGFALESEQPSHQGFTAVDSRAGLTGIVVGLCVNRGTSQYYFSARLPQSWPESAK
jgi:hypothetical protein